MVLAMPPGLAGVGAMKYGLFTGIKPGNWFAFSNGIMDFIYCFLAVLATSAVADDLVSMSKEYPVLMLLFQLLVVSVLIFFGYRSLKEGQDHQESIKNKNHIRKRDWVSKFEDKGPFLFGFAIAFTNAANPTFFGTLLSFTGYLHAEQVINQSMSTYIVLSAGFGLGNFFCL
jgi:threonine/homoserine/homoserine lactone efflux protein